MKIIALLFPSDTPFLENVRKCLTSSFVFSFDVSKARIQFCFFVCVLKARIQFFDVCQRIADSDGSILAAC